MVPLAVSEVLGLWVAHLAKLPLLTTLRLAAADGRAVLWTTAPERAQEARAAGELVFTPLEYEAAAYGAQEGRATAQDAARWLERKRSEPGWRLGAEEAVAGAVGLLATASVVRTSWRSWETRYDVPAGRLTWTVGQALEALGLELVGVDVHVPDEGAAELEAAE